MVDEAADLSHLAATLMTRPRSGAADPHRSTGVGAALAHAGAALAAAPDCLEQTVDVSSDGVNNEGTEPQQVYARNALEGVIVNALVVAGAPWEVLSVEGADEVTRWYSGNVVRGRGAFWIRAEGFDDFRRAMTLKLLRELTVSRRGGGSRGSIPG